MLFTAETMAYESILCCHKEGRRSRHLVIVMWLLILAGNLNLTKTETRDVCHLEELHISCDPDQVIVVESASFGRMSQGRCIVEDEYIGCTNDVLSLLDSWCSGKQSCSIIVPNDDLERANANCKRYLKEYLSVEFRCEKVDTRCRSDRPNIRNIPSGLISSHVTDSKACGTSRSPWVISANPGQTIQLTLTDFSVNKHSSNLISCPVVYGFIEEKAIGINDTICGGRDRQMALYTSKTNEVIIRIVARSERNNGQFLIKYEVTGCPELSRPAHAWYKREGNEAVIGCESNDKEWRLTCSGNKWIGEVGNCSEPARAVIPEAPKYKTIHFSSTVTMTAVAASALVLTVVTIVIGVVYIKKYRIRQETKFLTKTYSTIERNAQAYYRPVVIDQSADSNQMMSYPEQCVCATLQMRDQHAGQPMAPTSSLEGQSLYSSIKST